MRGCWLGFFLVASVVVFLGAIAFALLAPPGGGPRTTPVPVSTAAAMRFETKVANVQVATAPTTIEIDEEEATSKLVTLLATEPSAPNIDRPQITFRDGKIRLAGVARDTPIPVNFVVTGRVEAVAGRPQITVEKVDAGRLPVGDALQSQVEQLLADQDRLIGDLPITVTEIQVLEGKMVVTGQPK